MFQLFSRGGGLRPYRNRMRNRLQQTPSVRLLPGLVELPLLTGSDGRLQPASLLDHKPLLALCGPPGSGRSLALFQCAWEWAHSNRNEPLLYFSLAEIDALNLSPRAILTSLIHQSNQPSPLDDSAQQSRRWIMLIDHWEHLPETRREAWQTFLQALTAAWSRLRIVISLPAQQAWPSFASLHLPAPDDLRIRRWLNHLIPQHSQQAILAALQVGGPLASMRRSASDIALLALTYPSYGLPSSRSQLYERAEALFESLPPITSEELPGTNALYYADERRRFHYRLAHDIAVKDRLDQLSLLEESDLHDIVPLLVAQLPDPGSVYAQLWHADAVPVSRLPILTACLMERPAARPDWGLRILNALLGEQDQPPVRQALDDLLPQVPVVLAAAADQDCSAMLPELIAALTPLLGSDGMLRLLDDPQLSTDARWAMADSLVQLLEAEQADQQDTLTARPPPDALSRAARAYVLARSGPPLQQHLLSEPGRSWLYEFADSAVEQQRRNAAAQALLDNPALPAELRAEALYWLDGPAVADLRQQIADAGSSSHPALRRAALIVMQQHDPSSLLPFIRARIVDPALPWHVRHDLLPLLSEATQPEKLALLAHCCLTEKIPLEGRLEALRLISHRRHVTALLQRIALHQAAHPVVRAVALHHPAIFEQAPPLELLRSLAHMALDRQNDVHDLDPVLQFTAIATLGRLRDSNAAHGCLLQLLEHQQSDTATTLSLLEALAEQGRPAALPALHRQLTGDVVAARRDYWEQHAAHLAQVPLSDWPLVELPASARRQIQRALSIGETSADAPGTLNELIEQEEYDLLVGSASALAAIASNNAGQVRRLVRACLLAVLRRPYPAHLLRPLLQCLGRAGKDGGLHDYGQILGNPYASPELRWLTLEQLAALLEGGNVAPAIMALLLRYLDQENADPFSRATAALALGRSGFALALPPLQRLTSQNGVDEHLRMAAISGLGLLITYGNSDTRVRAEQSLLDLISNEHLPTRLRAIAAEGLSDNSSLEIRKALRDLLDQQRQQPALAAAVLKTLGRNQDREALGVILRYCQSEQSLEAIAAIEALLTFNDMSTMSTLVRVTLTTVASQSVRLTAVGALLQLGGSEYLPLLRSYLSDAPLPLRLQALEYLIRCFPSDSYLVTIANDGGAPRLLRLRAVEALHSQPEQMAALLTIAGNSQLETAIRIVAVKNLACYAEHVQAIDALKQIVLDRSAHWQLRRHAIAALFALAQKPPLADAAIAALARISDDTSLEAAPRCWAAQALIDSCSSRLTVQPAGME